MSILGQTSGSPADSQDQQDPTQNYPASPDQGGPVPSVQSQPTAAAPSQPQSGSRLGAIVQAIANVTSTALQGVPDTGRPGFVQGLGQGARAAQAAKSYQQAIKFRDMDTQIRVAQLHNQDLKLQNDTQEQRDAHVKAELDNRALANSLGIDYDTLPSNGQAVMDHLTAQTAANGSASVPPGTHLSGDGDTINIPKDTQATRDGQKQMYSMLAPALGLPSLSPSAQFVPSKNMDMLTNKLHGFDLGGNPYKHDDLPQIIAAEKTQRDQLAKSGSASPHQLQALDNVIAIHQTNLDALDKHKASVLDAASRRKQQEQATAIEEKGAQQRQTNDAKPQKPQSTDWVSGATADEKKKAELAENMVFNANNIASILQRRPDIVGKVAGRVTSLQQLAGTNDPDIVQLATDIHNIAMANNGIHGQKGVQAVTDFENKLLNNFKNGPRGIAGGLMGSVKSVQTFIDNARPDTYKTHSKNGGAIKAMVPNQ